MYHGRAQVVFCAGHMTEGTDKLHNAGGGGIKQGSPSYFCPVRVFRIALARLGVHVDPLQILVVFG